MQQNVLSVTQINEYLRSVMDSDPMLSNIAIRGEISNYKCYPSGHHYFTLKDDGAALKCVMFKGNAVRLRFRPENGMKVIAVGRITVYPRDGAYQLYCTAMAMDGVGDLYAAFEETKARLAQKGLFDPSHKKPIPKFPSVVGIVTSSAGAAVHDILRILSKRWPLCPVRIFPVRVQGAEAPAEIVAAIEFANRHMLADVLIVGRGGGSIEDLWAFNDEQVAYAIYRSQIPVISAVGHEPDVTISDYVADLRAATPSNAAELAVPDGDALLQLVDQYTASMASLLSKRITSSRQHLNALRNSGVLRNPLNYISQRRLALKNIQDRLAFTANQQISKNKQALISYAAKLDAMSPLKILSRGYSMATTHGGQLVSSVAHVSYGDMITVQVSDGRIRASVTGKKEEHNESSYL